MARAEIPLIIIDPATGNAIVGASVAVKLRATGASATVYAAETGATTVGNPRASDANGRVSGWCDRGAYQFDISGTGLTSYTEYWDAATSGDGGLDTAWLADGAVTSAKIGSAQVTSAKMAAGASAATFVTSLPGSPVDGQEVFYQSTTAGTGGGSTSMADVGAVWHLRYRSAASGSYKWEFVGGGQLSALQTAGLTTVTATTYATDAGAPVITVPVAGDYDVTFSAQTIDNTTAGYQTIMTAATSAPSNAVGDPLSAMYRQETNAGVNVMAPVSRTVRLTGLAASASLATYQRASGGTARFFYRSLIAVPIRVG